MRKSIIYQFYIAIILFFLIIVPALVSGQCPGSLNDGSGRRFTLVFCDDGCGCPPGSHCISGSSNPYSSYVPQCCIGPGNIPECVDVCVLSDGPTDSDPGCNTYGCCSGVDICDEDHCCPPATPEWGGSGCIASGPICGNGAVETGEDCEPPGSTCCDSSCNFIPNNQDPGDAYCPATCQVCNGNGACKNANSGTDVNNECGTANCGTGDCASGGVCGAYDDGLEHNCGAACKWCTDADVACENLNNQQDTSGPNRCDGFCEACNAGVCGAADINTDPGDDCPASTSCTSTCIYAGTPGDCNGNYLCLAASSYNTPSYKVCSGAGSAIDATSAALACDGNANNFCTAATCSGTVRYSECNAGACDNAAATYYEAVTVRAQSGYSLTNACGTTNNAPCDATFRASPGPGDNNYGAGGAQLCQGFCDGNGNCDWAGACGAGGGCVAPNPFNESWRVYPSNPAEGNGNGGPNNPADWACCPTDQHCVRGRACYPPGTHLDIDGNGRGDYFCYPWAGGDGWWINVDYHTNYCTAYGCYWNVGAGDTNAEPNYYTTTGSRPNYCTIGLAGTPSMECCCGDDAGEFYDYKRGVGPGQWAINWLSAPSDDACCNADGDCVSSGVCYDSGSIGNNLNPAGGVDNIARCTLAGTSLWADVDSASGPCSLASLNWVVAGELPLGEYGDTTNGGAVIIPPAECCGDDAGEYYARANFAGPTGDNNPWNTEYSLKDADDSGISSYTSDACCNAGTDCVWGNACYTASGSRVDTGYANNKRVICFSPNGVIGAWLDCDGGSGGHCGAVTDNCGYGWNADIASGEAVSHGGYNNGAADGIECCGDDINENITIEETYSMAIAFDNDQSVCCNIGSDCVAGTSCYTAQSAASGNTYGGLNPGGNDNLAHCFNNAGRGEWLDCDQADFMDFWCWNVCNGKHTGEQKLPRSPTYSPDPNWNAVSAGEANVGEYSGAGTLGCCGDDAGEYYKLNPVNWNIVACCNGINDCVDASGACISSTGVEGSAQGNCDDGIDNDCDGEDDWDTWPARGTAHGDRDCAVQVSAIQVINSTPCPSQQFYVLCTPNPILASPINSLEARIDGTTDTCRFQNWNGNRANFSCIAPSTPGPYQVRCYVNYTKSYSYAANQSAGITVGGAACCDQYTPSGSGICEGDTACDWCPACGGIGNRQTNGLAQPPVDKCVTALSCARACDRNPLDLTIPYDFCNATCDNNDAQCSNQTRCSLVNPKIWEYNPANCDLATCLCNYLGWARGTCTDSKNNCGASCGTGETIACITPLGYPGIRNCNESNCEWNATCYTGLYCGDGMINGTEECDFGPILQPTQPCIGTTGTFCNSTCQNQTSALEANANCTDDVDNDCDGYIDGCDISNCLEGQGVSGSANRCCNNLIDDDGDTYPDMDDPGCCDFCVAPAGFYDPAPGSISGNGTDCGDRDFKWERGATEMEDYCCGGGDGTAENFITTIIGGIPYSACCDAATDCVDSNGTCQIGTELTPDLCIDGLDNDCDGLVDCDDPDCSGNLTGTVSDEQNRWVPGALVKSSPPGRVPQCERNTTTDHYGHYKLTGVLIGNYGVIARKAGFDDNITFVNMLPNTQINNFNFVLRNGSCHADCTDSYGNCNPECDGLIFKNALGQDDPCTFSNLEKCAYRPRGFRATQADSYDQYVTEYVCCEGAPRTYRKLKAIITGDVENLYVYKTVVKMGEKYVTMNIAYWYPNE